MTFDHYIGIDYSGAETPESRLKSLQVFCSTSDLPPGRVMTLAAPTGRIWNWTRMEIASWLIELCEADQMFVAGIDHAFSFPESYCNRYGLRDWDEFLVDFCRHWPTDKPHTYVDFLRDGNPRVGQPGESRLTENWMSSAKGVFTFEGRSQAAKSAHAGIPWLKRIRDKTGGKVHFWPFDGWEIPDGKSAIVEIYPSIFKKRYPRDGRTNDEQDAYSISRWLNESDAQGILGRYLQPPLTDEERSAAEREGWILGIS